MKAKSRLPIGALLLGAGMGLASIQTARADGIPEPSLTFYGTIRNLAENNMRVTWGTLTWQLHNEASGQTVILTTPVTNVLDQFSYVLEVPCEQYVSGNFSSNVLNLSGASLSFDRSQIQYSVQNSNLPVALVQPAQANVVLSVHDRGRLERIDLQIDVPCEDKLANGLCDDWERQYFGTVGLYGPADDPDGDGMSNWAEYQAGTNPMDYSSAFQFLSYVRLNPKSVRLEWQSADGRFYSLLRYPSLLSANATVVQSNIMATRTVTTWVDTNAPTSGTCFYRLLLEP